MRVRKKTVEDLTEVIVAQALEITKLKRHVTTLVDERRAYRQRYFEMKEKEGGK